MTKKAPSGALRKSILAASVAACFTLTTQHAAANPTGPSVVSGSAGFATSGSTLTITNSANAIINWQGFSIGINEITRFLQSSSGSAVLNRVVGSGGVIPQSVIDGMLQSNGRVFLLNPMGVVIGQNARIDVAGLVASSLNLSNDDFLAGRTRFTEVPGAGAVVNNGTIQTSSGGRVFLVAPSVENNGVINAPQGEIFLAAGKSAELVNEGSPLVTVRITADAEQALNVGQLVAESGRIGMYGALVRNSGVAEANGAVAGPGGTIRFVASKDLTLDAGSRTTANGTSGGDVLLQAQGGTNLISGTVEAKGSAGAGGNVQALGVRVGVIGHGVIDASGETGGGAVLVGGDYQGKNADVQNAQQTLIGPDGIIRADAGATGDGGRVIVWSDEYTRFYGSVSARGGTQSGNGGFVETSGHVLDAIGAVNVGATNGNRGSWLIDPFDLNIVDSGLTVSPISPNFISFTDAPATGTSTLGMDVINSALASYGSVTAQTQHDMTFATSTTNVVFNAGLVTAYAGNNINLGSHNIVGNGTKFVVSANSSPYNTVYGSGTGSITSNPGFGNVSTGGGAVVASGYNVTVGNIDTTGASSADTSVNINAANMATTGSIATGNAIAVNSSANSNVSITGPNGIVINGGIATGSSNASGGSFYASSSAISLQPFGSAASVSVHGSLSTGVAASSSSGGSALSDIFISSPSIAIDGNLVTQGATSAGGSAYTDVTFGPCCTPMIRSISVGGSITTGNGSGSYGNSATNVYGSVSGGTFSVGGGITTGNAPSSSFVNIQGGDVKVGSVVTGTAGNGTSGVSAYASTGNIVTGSIATGASPAAYGSSAVTLSAYGSVQTGSITTGGSTNTSVLESAFLGNVVTGSIATGAAGSGNSFIGLLASYGSVQAGSLSSGSAYGSGAFAFGMGDVTTGAINTRATDPSFPGGLVSLFSYGGSVNVSGLIDARGADGTAAHPAGSAGGPVLISALNSVMVGPTPTIGVIRPVINTSGGAGAPGGAGGAAGPILVDPTTITFNGTLLGVGGAGNGAAGGAGGLLFLDTTNGTGVVTFINGGYDVSGGPGSPPGLNGIVTINGSIVFITLLNPLSDPSVAQSFGAVIKDLLTTTNDQKQGENPADDGKKKKGGFSSCKA